MKSSKPKPPPLLTLLSLLLVLLLLLLTLPTLTTSQKSSNGCILTLLNPLTSQIVIITDTRITLNPGSGSSLIPPSIHPLPLLSLPNTVKQDESKDTGPELAQGLKVLVIESPSGNTMHVLSCTGLRSECSAFLAMVSEWWDDKLRCNVYASQNCFNTIELSPYTHESVSEYIQCALYECNRLNSKGATFPSIQGLLVSSPAPSKSKSKSKLNKCNVKITTFDTLGSPTSHERDYLTTTSTNNKNEEIKRKYAIAFLGGGSASMPLFDSIPYTRGNDTNDKTPPANKNKKQKRIVNKVINASSLLKLRSTALNLFQSSTNRDVLTGGGRCVVYSIEGGRVWRGEENGRVDG